MSLCNVFTTAASPQTFAFGLVNLEASQALPTQACCGTESQGEGSLLLLFKLLN